MPAETSSAPAQKSEADLMALYSKRILALTAAIPHLGRLEAPQASVSRRAPLCGSTVTVDVALGPDGRIAAFAQEPKACALGQASASILGGGALGRTPAEIAEARDALRAMLKEGAAPPDGPFADLEVLTAARGYPNRHPSILLAFEALAEAASQAAQNTAAQKTAPPPEAGRGA